jgi:hypothetical protein
VLGGRRRIPGEATEYAGVVTASCQQPVTFGHLLTEVDSSSSRLERQRRVDLERLR